METEREKKRSQTLKDMRAKEREEDKGACAFPAVHPRYRTSYSAIYGETEEPAGTLGIRLFICILLFGCFIAADKEQIHIPGYSTDSVLRAIERPFSLSEVKQFDLPSVL